MCQTITLPVSNVTECSVAISDALKARDDDIFDNTSDRLTERIASWIDYNIFSTIFADCHKLDEISQYIYPYCSLKSHNWELIYRETRDGRGHDHEIFHEYCNFEGQLIIAILSDSNEITGGYTKIRPFVYDYVSVEDDACNKCFQIKLAFLDKCAFSFCIYESGIHIYKDNWNPSEYCYGVGSDEDKIAEVEIFAIRQNH